MLMLDQNFQTTKQSRGRGYASVAPDCFVGPADLALCCKSLLLAMTGTSYA
jgi:hypothetical protein